MNVAIVVPWDQKTGGVASVVGNLARSLESKGHSVVFLFLGHGSILRRKRTKWDFQGYEIALKPPLIPGHRVRSWLSFIANLVVVLPQITYLLLSRQIDVVNIHYPIDGFVSFAVLRRLLPFKLVTSVHGADVRGEPHSRALQFLLLSSHRVVSPSRAFQDDVLQAFPGLSSKALCIHNGIDLAELEALSSKEVSEEQNSILTVAAHNGRKGVDTLIRAFAIVHRRTPTLKLILAGDGPARKDLEKLVSSLALQDHVCFVGWVERDEVVRLLRTCLVFVLASRLEPFGLAIVEAMACGAPVIATKVGGITEIISDGRDGILVEPNNPEQLASAIELVIKDEVLRKSLRSQGPPTVRAKFSTAKNGAAYEELFRLVSRHR